MRVVRDQDLRWYADAVLPWLESDAGFAATQERPGRGGRPGLGKVANNVPHNLITQRLDGQLPTEPDALWLRVLDDRDQLVGVAMRTPPWGLLVTAMPRDAAAALADYLAEREPDLPSVSGPATTSRDVATRYAERTGAAVTPGMAQRMYRLDAVTPPHGVAGSLREATIADRDVLVRWFVAFGQEAAPDHPARSAEVVESRLAERGAVWLWRVGDEPVSMAMLHPPAAGVVRVSAVYTPPERRRNGYASALVAAISQHALDRGAVACMLYTDLANPTSNAIYQRIGYRPLLDVQEWRFGR